MSTAVGIILISSNIVMVGVFAYTAHKLTKIAQSLEQRIVQVKDETAAKLRRAMKEFL